MTAAANSIEEVVRHGRTVAQKSYHNYDKVSPSGDKTKQGLAAIQYEKRFSGTTMIVVEEVRTGRKKLALKTMYKRPG